MDYFIIIILMIFFLVIYVMFDPYAYMKKEKYENMIFAETNDDDLMIQGVPVFMKSNRGDLYQGISIPAKYNPKDSDFNDPSTPSVDGNINSPHSMHMFAYNRCAPECCKDSPYSCSKGCICLSPAQYTHLDSRGQNRELNKCTFEGRM